MNLTIILACSAYRLSQRCQGPGNHGRRTARVVLACFDPLAYKAGPPTEQTL
jgi:hypothetical protein